MKVNIGNYKSKTVSNILENHLIKKYGFEKYVHMTEDDFDNKDLIIKKIDNFMQYIYDNTVNLFEKERKIKVKIEDHDVISADTTLAYIILPLLKKYKENLQSAPFVENCDVPEHLHYTDEELEKFNTDGTPDTNYFERWDYIVDSMIWSFEQLIIESSGEYIEDFFSGYSDIYMMPIDQFGNETNKDKADYFKLMKGPNHTQEFDLDSYKKHQKDIEFGINMFGKYYRSLWV